jgi:hypothetical protein
MSDALAIAAVTTTIRNLLFTGVNAVVPGTEVTARPLDSARNGRTGNQLNVFLYHTSIAPAWRNEDFPGKVRPGETGFPPLPLSLYYLITAYGLDDDETVGHRLLGAGMSALHDHPLLGTAELRLALPESNLADQVERIRITSQPMGLDELSKLWTSFQTQYRVSAAYQASVVLIESRNGIRAPVPVLSHGEGDAGPVSRPDLLSGIPTLESVVTPRVGESAVAGDDVTLRGHGLAASTVRVRIIHPLLADPVDAAPSSAESTEIHFSVPDAVPAGVTEIAVVLEDPGKDHRLTNSLALAVGPAIQSALPLTAARDGFGRVSLDVDVKPEVRVGQRAYLIVGDRQIQTRTAPPATTLTFTFDAEPGDYRVRLRVGGVDSPLVDRSVEPPEFDESKRLVVT